MDTRASQDVTMTETPMSNNPNDMTAMSEEFSSTLLSLPLEMLEEQMYPRWPLKVLGLFAQASHQAEAETAFSRLVPSCIDAEPESYQQGDETRLAAIAILKRHPELLFRTSEVTDHYGRRIKGSCYRLLLGAGDTWALKQVHELIIPNIENGEYLAKLEFQAQFPFCPWQFTEELPEEVLYDERNKKQIEDVIAQLKIIAEKITDDPCTNGLATLDETTKAVEKLWEIFAPKEGEIIETGLHFPLGIMKEIGKVWGDQVAWNKNRLAFFSRTVIGPATAALSAVDGQFCKYGLVYLNMNKGPDRRDGLFCPHPKGIPPDLAPLADKLGRTMFADPFDGGSCFLSSNSGYFDWYNKNSAHGEFVSRGTGIGYACFGWPSYLDKLWRTKAEAIGSYYAATQREVNTSSRGP